VFLTTVVEEEDEVETKEVEVVAGGQRKRKLQQVTTQRILINLVKWMIEDDRRQARGGCSLGRFDNSRVLSAGPSTPLH
jgi:hypothetical protein